MNKHHTRKQGFALVVTLSLMILLTIIAVGLLTLSSISLRSASQSEAMQVARSNARLALMMAIGDLQKHLGPDTRISARAETLAKDSRVGVTVAAETPAAWWVGVSDSNPEKPLGGTGGNSVVWLVSGVSGATPGAQVASAPQDPVTMIDGGSLDLATATKGSPIQAGRVKITNQGKVSGAYAYFVDDNGMKAQLAASKPAVRNDSTAGPSGGPYGGGILPGTYDLSILNQMGGLSSGAADLQKLVSTNNLPMVKLSKEVTKAKFFSYTTSSQGVLSDVKNGGLKKDLSIAFENAAVFDRVFPAARPDQYILVDPKKRPTELATGYIHWGIFRDYYNLKKRFIGNSPTLAPTLFQKNGLLNELSNNFQTGRLGPHAMAANAPTHQAGHPYGNFAVSAIPGSTPSTYVFNPITPIMSSLQQTAWVAPNPDNPSSLRTHVQMFTSHYNPYNVRLLMNANATPAAGPRIQNYPQVLFTVGGTTINKANGLDSKLQTHVPFGLTLEPGRSHVMGFGSDVAISSEIDGSKYTDKIGKVITESVRRDHATTTSAASVPLTVEFALMNPTLMHGMDENPGDLEIAQVFFTPFAWDRIDTSGGRPGKRFSRTVQRAQLNRNSSFSMGFNLRTTREPQAGAIRPLVDANIRAMWNNPRWDSPLNLPLLAGYSAEGNGEVTNGIPQMEVATGDRGFAYWGSSRGPAVGNDRVILFDIPRKDLVSIGQLQHASAGRFSYEPTYIVGNSYANPRIPPGGWQASVNDTYSATRGLPWAISGAFRLYDASYLVNEVIFDSYTFTTLPQVADDFPGNTGLAPTAATYTGLLNGSQHLPNPRYLPFVPAGSDFNQSSLRVTGNASQGSFFHNSGHLVVDGSFNVNSTSVDAWEAFLSGTHALPVPKLNVNGVISGFTPTGRVRFPRAASHLGDGMTSNAINGNYWTGFRELEQNEVREIAEQIVREIKERGPFLTLGQFVNRKLENSEHGKSGALQAALDATVNRNLGSSFESASDSGTHKNIPANSTQGAGFPGQLLQGDVLQALAPYMTVRSDTFTIRGYGEARDASNRVIASAWCEAVVQRTPNPVERLSGGAAPLQELASPSSPFGRRFGLLGFRWLHPEEV